MTQQTIDGLKSLLRKDEANLERLLTVLESEHEALAGNDMAALESATSEKDSLLNAIRERAKRKIRLLVELGYHPDSGQAASAFLRENANDPELLERWERAQAQLDRCQQKNAVNGRILGHLQRRVTRISDIIRGADSNQSLYSSGGETRSLNHSHVLASV